MTVAPEPDVKTFRSRFNQISAVIAWLLCATMLIAIIVAGTWKAIGYLPIVALVAVLAWIGLWRPAVVVSNADIVLINALSTIRIPWAALIQVDTRFALTLYTPRAHYTATAAPAPGRLTVALSKRDTKGIQPSVVMGGRVRPGDLPITDSGAAAYLIRDRWEKLSAAGQIEVGIADTTQVERRWHWISMGISLVLLVGGLVALTIA
jgi:hypothetical protein